MKICIMFLTYGNPLHKKQWESWVSNPDCITLIHPKYRDMIQPYWEPYVSSTVIETSWGADTIVTATLLLMAQALQKGADWCLLCSEDSYPLKTCDETLAYLRTKTQSIFHPIDKKNPLKMSQWFAMCKKDAELLVRQLDVQVERGTIGNRQLFQSVVSRLPRKAAVDELFFVPLLRQINPHYSFESGVAHYVKWIPHWVSKHPTVFNKLLPSDKTEIERSNALFIRKTFEGFSPAPYELKASAMVVTLGTENIGKVNYSSFLETIKHTHDLYLLVMVDSLNDIEEGLKSQCVQCFFVVWNMADKAYEMIRQVLPNTYESVTILKEADSPSVSVSHSEAIEVAIAPPTPAPVPVPVPPHHPHPVHKIQPPHMPPPPPPHMPSHQHQPHQQMHPHHRFRSTVDHKRNYKVAFLFLLRGDINQPQIWSEYFNRETYGKTSFYVHSKEVRHLRTRWLYDNLIRDIRPTGWGYIVDAYFSLFRTAMSNPDNEKFVIISESCLPIHGFRDFKHFLDNGDYRESYVHFMRPTTYDQRARIETQEGYHHLEPFTKHYARMCLSRYHVEKLLSQPRTAIEFFIRMHVGDEFFLTLLHAREGEDFFVNKTITYDNWEDVHEEIRHVKERIRQLEHEMKYRRTYELEGEINHLKHYIEDIAKNPKTYNEVNGRDIHNAFRSGAFFWRKFPDTIRMLQHYSKYGELIAPRMQHHGGPQHYGGPQHHGGPMGRGLKPKSHSKKRRSKKDTRKRRTTKRKTRTRHNHKTRSHRHKKQKSKPTGNDNGKLLLKDLMPETYLI